ncbi:MAG: hypothetical protein R6U41_07285 [Desulfosalsimonas sp.]|uniref:hypothetical protein n=1 Tax=Desulfosalsimonas sp. TaxID=3073848 RepID=UPI003970E637
MSKMSSEALLKQSEHLQALYGQGSETVRNATSRIGAFSEGLRELENLEKNPSPYDSEASRIRQRHQRAVTLQKKCTQLENGTYDALSKRRQSLEQTINQRADLSPKGTDSEIRQVIREAKPKDRLAMITEAIKTGDTVTLSAIANGNKVLTGLDDDTRKNLLDSYKRRVAPDEFSEQQAVDNFLTEATGVFQTAHEAVKSYQDAEAVDAADRQAQKADEVVGKVNQLFEEV